MTDSTRMAENNNLYRITHTEPPSDDRMRFMQVDMTRDSTHIDMASRLRVLKRQARFTSTSATSVFT